MEENTPLKIGITLGDFNGIGPEVVLKALNDPRLLRICTPVIYGSARVVARYKKLLNMESLSYHQVQGNSLNDRRINVVNCWDDSIEVQPGQVSEQAGKCAVQALQKSTEDLKNKLIDAVVTAPINKFNIQGEGFDFPGHTEYYAAAFEQAQHLMLMVADGLRIGTVTGHIPLVQVPAKLTRELVSQKLDILLKSLQQDFGIVKPRVAVLGLNPHAGEEGLLGDEEIAIISPVLEQFKEKGHLVFGPFPADGFFGMMHQRNYDAVLAMYHDQGLTPFKMMAFESGVNFTAGLPIVRTSPDHGTAYNIAGQGIADEGSMRAAIFLACDVVRERAQAAQKRPKRTAKLVTTPDDKDEILKPEAE